MNFYQGKISFRLQTHIISKTNNITNQTNKICQNVMTD